MSSPEGEARIPAAPGTEERGSPNANEQWIEGVVRALNSPVREPVVLAGIVPKEGVDKIAQKAADYALSGQTALQNGDWRERYFSNYGLTKLLSEIKNPDALVAVIARADKILEKSNLKLAFDSNGDIWEGHRDTATSQFYPAVELVVNGQPPDPK